MWGITLAGYVLMPAAWALDADVRNQSGGIDMGPDPQCPFLPVSNRYFPKGIAYCFLETGLCYLFVRMWGCPFSTHRPPKAICFPWPELLNGFAAGWAKFDCLCGTGLWVGCFAVRLRFQCVVARVTVELCDYLGK